MQASPSHSTAEICNFHVSEPPVLRPILGAALARLVRSAPQALFELTQAYGSPLNVVVPDVLVRNVEALRAVLHRHGVAFQIFYGAKVNKSPALVSAAVQAGIGIDVSSVYEMRDALRAGVAPARLCATGPAKTRVFHMAAIANDALISVDSPEELKDIEAVIGEIEPDRPARVLLRYRPEASGSSRFGMSAEALLACMRRVARRDGMFSFEGFHFHLGGYRYETRAAAVRELVSFVEAARAMGLAPKTIDIGGGLPAQYVEPARYDAFVGAQGAGDYRNGQVPASFYPYGGAIGACDWLDGFLAAPCARGLSIAGYLKEQELALAIEPGRSLADQTAVSIFRVTRVKSLAPGEAVIFAEGSSFSACETWFSSEFLVDPILISTRTDGIHGEPHDRARDDVPVHAWIAGHSCLDEDVLTNRLIRFERRPEAGDLLVYANTAGYQMDLLENEFHRHPMPRRIAVSFDAAGRMGISPDVSHGESE
ncbi:Y4yA family PLP-dependent enzyme [Trinickia caryophylli]|uniref:Diaminopimelate decarboxylase n=1 Tax=Trinickia caryophylli TaxID=28094 RepID=A0A1X7D511_TRICW|nr:Y4yA family PLP-dependent enzyme [Trinickia caryophylli]PMS12725.1 Y4yA family PLP-dependent enzyme [Trinickia caryophylli]TRX15132.1 Y4yA family PLP-dependent enzyme [Trinickia caryophylli]WQE14995.1 Y4yA family PLP-dependent enzyme [Trinickia caryophylli]SMF09032.1 diaminopimelate decarboxylase [Trinickia caryophylli]GLU31276.1 hypothetical protein Busp01_11180 [Trinickia caryophylli]